MPVPWLNPGTGSPLFPMPGSPRERPVVLGLGNVLLSDEGAGVHAVAALKRLYAFRPEIDVVDGGTMGLDLLPLFQDRSRILILDAVDFKKAPGHVQTLEGDRIPSLLGPKFSVHHIGLADLLFTAQLTGQSAQEIVLIGVQPGVLAMGLELSGPVISGLDFVIAHAIRKLEQWDIHAERTVRASL